MLYFVIRIGLLLGSASSVRADGWQINGPECGIPTRGMIVNGTAAGTNQFPWMVYLAIRETDIKDFQCGGSILTKRHILTAAHCTHTASGRPVKMINAYYGNSDWTRGKILGVTKVVRHPEYHYKEDHHDIAVLEVEKPFQYGNDARPICIPEAPMNILDTDTIVAGWGYLKEGGSSTNHLRYTIVRVMPNEMCAAVYPKDYDSEIMYCAYREGTDACKSDSGGPAISLVGRRFVQVGIVAFGEGCARPNTPGVYTLVEAFTPWIKQVLVSFEKVYSSEVQLASYTAPQWSPIFQFL